MVFGALYPVYLFWTVLLRNRHLCSLVVISAFVPSQSHVASYDIFFYLPRTNYTTHPLSGERIQLGYSFRNLRCDSTCHPTYMIHVINLIIVCPHLSWQLSREDKRTTCHHHQHKVNSKTAQNTILYAIRQQRRRQCRSQRTRNRHRRLR